MQERVGNLKQGTIPKNVGPAIKTSHSVIHVQVEGRWAQTSMVDSNHGKGDKSEFSDRSHALIFQGLTNLNDNYTAKFECRFVLYSHVPGFVSTATSLSNHAFECLRQC